MLFGYDLFLKWKPAPEEFTAPLVTPPPFLFRLDRFPKGIDNAHIDVVLSSKLVGAAKGLIKLMIQHDAHENLSWGRVAAPGAQDVDQFQRTYISVMEAALGIARKNSRPELIQLVAFAAIKFLLMQIEEEIERFRNNLQQQRGFDAQQTSGRTVQLHERLVALTREMPAIRHRVAHRLFNHVLKVESTVLRKLRKSMLGRSWPVPREVMFNPILLLPSLWADEQVMRNYSLISVNRDKLTEFALINAVICEIFADYLPDWVQPPFQVREESDLMSGEMALRLRTDQGALTGFLDVELVLSRALREEEYLQGKTSWLDEPLNMERVLLSELSVAADQRADGAQRRDLPEEDKRRIAFRAQLVKEAESRFKSAGILDRIYAAREAPLIYDELQRQLPARLILEYLEGGISRPKMARRLATIKGIASPDDVLRRLEAGKSSVRRLSRDERRQCVADFIVNFTLLRRDLKLAHRAYWIMNQMRILTEPDHIELARRNRTLNQFVLPEEQASAEHEIRNHVILKADLRGSSKITRELRERNLNPATHFSLNFFGPINKLLERFGARKVFVEGDAVILSIYEYEDSPHDWLAVARASGLARKILEVVDAQNAQNRKYNLPDLELGMGIAFLDEAPAFLYDGEHEIMISSAINRADRLSSCAASLRTTALGRSLPRGVEVVAPVDQGIMQKDSGDNLLRYNVNGVELDQAAFTKLQHEIAFHRIEARFPQYSPQSVFYVGRYPDTTGLMQWVIVREATVRLWIGNDVSMVEEGGRMFYEVVTDPEVMNRLKDKLAAIAQSARKAPRRVPTVGGEAKTPEMGTESTGVAADIEALLKEEAEQR